MEKGRSVNIHGAGSGRCAESLVGEYPKGLCKTSTVFLIVLFQNIESAVYKLLWVILGSHGVFQIVQHIIRKMKRPERGLSAKSVVKRVFCFLRQYGKGEDSFLFIADSDCTQIFSEKNGKTGMKTAGHLQAKYFLYNRALFLSGAHSRTETVLL